MNKIKSFLYRFMYGRYGVDTMYWWCMGAVLALWIIRSILSVFNLTVAAFTIYILSNVILVYALFRFFSKNRYKRALENRKFCTFIGSIGKIFTLLHDRFRDRKTHVYKKCPGCKAVLRLPKKKGEHTVCCPKCQKKFDVKI